MTADHPIAEIVAKLDALEAKATSSWAWGDSDMRFFAALRNHYPALRAAVLRVAELEDIGRRVLKGIDDWNDAVTSIIDCERRTWPALEELRAALTAPQGEEQSRG